MADRPRGTWVRINAAAYMDPAIIRVGSSAEVLFYRSIQYAGIMQNGGKVSAEGVRALLRGLPRGKQLPSKLCAEGLWTEDKECAGYVITNYLKYNPEGSSIEDVGARQSRDRERKRVQRGSTPKDVSHADKIPRARGNDTDDTYKGSDRTPSGSVRSEPAPAAPRSAGGAAQPGDETDVVPSGSEPKLNWRTELAKGRAKNPASTGRDVPLRNGHWSPNRATTSSRDSLSKLDEAIAEMHGGDE